jgi:regulator of RNase E activity RraA
LTVIKALSEAEPGDVMVIDTMGSNRTVIGELFGTESTRRGIQAIVLDGPCRDTAPLSTMDIPVYCTGVRPVSGTANKLYATQVPVMCGGVVVHPGDIIFGDDDGIVVASQAHMEAILPAAEGVVAAEAALLAGMHSGVSLLDQLNFAEHNANVEGGDANSKLQFKTGVKKTEIA